MFLTQDWRVLTVGDGDLTFSYSLKKHHPISSLTASVLDSKAQLTEKYSDNGVSSLNALNVNTIFEMDITRSESWPNALKQQFDLVIFQFPLVPAAVSKQQFDTQLNQNLANRFLLRRYLLACFEYFLDPQGARQSYITSKEVKPYSHWQIETDLTVNSNINYLGKQAFNYALFPDYQIRNVDRDKKVKDTKGFIYAYSDKPQSDEITKQFMPFKYLQSDHCPLCRVGPFSSKENESRHLASSKHIKLAKYQQDWFNFLN